MKKIFIIFFACITSLPLSFAQNPDAILGKWITEGGNCIVEVYRQGKEYKGKLVWYNNKDPEKVVQAKKFVGADVLHNLHYDTKEDEWVDGIIYDVLSGKEWDSVAWLTKENELKVKGYWLFRWISSTKTFKRF